MKKKKFGALGVTCTEAGAQSAEIKKGWISLPSLPLPSVRPLIRRVTIGHNFPSLYLIPAGVRIPVK